MSTAILRSPEPETPYAYLVKRTIEACGVAKEAAATAAEGREQPPVEPETQPVPEAVAEAPDTTTTKKQVEDPTKLEKSGDPKAEKKSGKAAGSKPTKKGKT